MPPRPRAAPPAPGPHPPRTRRRRQQVRPPGRAHPTRPIRPTRRAAPPARAVRPRRGWTPPRRPLRTPWWRRCSPRLTHRSWCSGCSTAAAIPRLRAQLHQLHQQGRPVATTLAAVPAARLQAARDPASYLSAAVHRHPLTAPLRPTGPDRAVMADLVRTAMPDTVADKVVACRAWPALTRRLEAWTDEGLPVADLLADLPAGRVFQARTPAAYTAHLMDLKVAAHRTGARAEHGARTRVDTASRPSPAEARAGRSAGPVAAADAADNRGPDAAGPDAAGPDRSARTSPAGRRFREPAAADTCGAARRRGPRPVRRPRHLDDLRPDQRERPSPGASDATGPAREHSASPDAPGRGRGPGAARGSGPGTDESWVIGDPVIGDSRDRRPGDRRPHGRRRPRRPGRRPGRAATMSASWSTGPCCGPRTISTRPVRWIGSGWRPPWAWDRPREPTGSRPACTTPTLRAPPPRVERGRDRSARHLGGPLRGHPIRGDAGCRHADAGRGVGRHQPVRVAVDAAAHDAGRVRHGRAS